MRDRLLVVPAQPSTQNYSPLEWINFEPGTLTKAIKFFRRPSRLTSIIQPIVELPPSHSQYPGPPHFAGALFS